MMGNYHVRFGKEGRTGKRCVALVQSEDTKKKLSLIKKGNKLSEKTRAKLSLIGIKREGVSVEVKNINSGEIKQYLSLTSASLDLGVSRTAIRKAIEKK